MALRNAKKTMALRKTRAKKNNYYFSGQRCEKNRVPHDLQLGKGSDAAMRKMRTPVQWFERAMALQRPRLSCRVNLTTFFGVFAPNDVSMMIYAKIWYGYAFTTPWNAPRTMRTTNAKNKNILRGAKKIIILGGAKKTCEKNNKIF